MSTAVVSIKPFYVPEANRSDLRYWFRIAVSEVSVGSYEINKVPDYAYDPVEAPQQPHFFKRLYKKALDRASLSCRIAQETLEKLKSVHNWQDEVRRLAYAFYDAFNRSEEAYAEVWAEYQAAQSQNSVLTVEQVDRVYQAVRYRIESDNLLKQQKEFFLGKLAEEIGEFECDWRREDFQDHIDSLAALKERIFAKVGKHPHTTFYIVLIRACKKVLEDWI
jgi:hypothetical protein